MPYPADIVRCSHRGVFLAGSGGDEVEDEFVFNLNLWLHKDPGVVFAWDEEIQNIADGVATKFEDHFGDYVTLLGNSVRYTHVRAYHLDADGRALDVATGLINGTTGLIGGGGNSLPPEVALCVTLDNVEAGSFSADKKHRTGRFYLPSPAVGVVNSDGSLTAAKQSSFNEWLQGWLEDVQGMHIGGGALETHLDLVVVSPTTGQQHQVKEFRVGRVLDVQRRRRRSIAENYSHVVVHNH